MTIIYQLISPYFFTLNSICFFIVIAYFNNKQNYLYLLNVKRSINLGQTMYEASPPIFHEDWITGSKVILRQTYIHTNANSSKVTQRIRFARLIKCSSFQVGKVQTVIYKDPSSSTTIFFLNVVLSWSPTSTTCLCFVCFALPALCHVDVPYLSRIVRLQLTLYLYASYLVLQS